MIFDSATETIVCGDQRSLFDYLSLGKEMGTHLWPKVSWSTSTCGTRIHSCSKVMCEAEQYDARLLCWKN